MFKNKKTLRIILIIILFGFAFIGVVFSLVFVAMKLHITDVKGSIDSRNEYFNNVRDLNSRVSATAVLSKDWETSLEFETFKEGIIKDQDIIIRVSNETGVSGRLIVASVISEQLRFFTSNRESFKKYFEPLKVLGTYSQFSYGISGIKMDTAKEVEDNLKDPTSPFYLGKDYENILDYTNPNDTNIDSQRLARFTDSHDHYYSYLYTALYLKEIMHQWDVALYPIDNRPEVLVTLFNLGFSKSIPKENPEVGGSTITINGIDYTFGGLAYEFYYGGELSDIFPFEVQ